MSLKAKIEAVVYAAEEPVTLVQLAGLFADEALEWKREQEAKAAEEKAAQELEARAAEGIAEPELPIEVMQETEEQGEASHSVASSIEPLVAPLATPETDEEPAAETEAAAKENAVEPEPQAEASSEGAEEPAPEVEAEAETAPAEAEEAPAAEMTAAVEEAPIAESAEEPGAAEEAKPVDPAQLEAEEKRAARQREREIRDILRGLLDELIAEYAIADRGIEIREIAGGYRLATKPEYHDAVRGFIKSLKPPMKLSLQALETLAVIAYKQPITAPEVSEVRGVDSAGVLGSLISRKLVTTAGRKQVVGRPILYKTTKEFLVRFGLKDLNELPSMEEFEKMATGALAEVDEAIQQSSQNPQLQLNTPPAEEPETNTEEGQVAPTSEGVEVAPSEEEELPAASGEEAAEGVAAETAAVEEAVAVHEEMAATEETAVEAEEAISAAETAEEAKEAKEDSSATETAETVESDAEETGAQEAEPLSPEEAPAPPEVVAEDEKQPEDQEQPS